MECGLQKRAVNQNGVSKPIETLRVTVSPLRFLHPENAVEPHMNTSLRIMLCVGALIAWAGLGLQFRVSHALLAAQGLDVWQTLSRMLAYFTILTNLLVAIYYTARLVAPTTRIARWFAQPAVSSAIAMYVVLVSVIVYLILRHIVTLTGDALLADNILHYVTPALFVIFWIGWVPKRQLRWRYALWWSLYPLGYFVYALLRGAASGFYPYPFIDVAKLGYGAVAINAVGIAAAFVLSGLIVVAIDRRWPVRGREA